MKEEYYSAIKGMVLSERYLPYDYGPVDSYQVYECALYALATYQRKEDSALISARLSQNVFDFNKWSFEIIIKYPSKFHFSLLEKYYKDYFYQNFRPEERMWAKGDFIRSVASYKNERSAEILNEILSKDPILPSIEFDISPLTDNLYNSILNNPCSLYEKFKTRADVKEYARNQQHYSNGKQKNTYSRAKDLERW